MSGVMLKTAVYGVLRVSFDLLGHEEWWWGLVPLALGLFAALFGAVFAAVQTDMKRLLAYSSIENLGIIFSALGLALVFRGAGMLALAALALIALLYHSLNHAFIKSLLFLGTGAVLHSTGERNLGRLGGLIHRMPWVAALTLVGALAMSGLPPLNGFVSEWLLLQAFLFAHQVPHTFVNMLLPMGAALLVLAAALAAYVMVKFFGVTFLGRPREASLARAHDAGVLERIGLVWLALGCVALGLLPTYVIGALRPVVEQLGAALPPGPPSPWWLLAPVPGRQVSYSPIVFFLAIVAIVIVTMLAVRLFYHGHRRAVRPWDCGFGELTPRMQDTAEGFGQPIRHIFGSFFAITRELPSPFDRTPRYSVTVADRIWQGLYLPLGRLVQRATDAVAWLQQGRIATYLLYSFVTLVLLLALVL
jgi:formate hydrogenlyase subunit 3/multisubunit Na+/H+ antiporter MnhD subunit